MECVYCDREAPAGRMSYAGCATEYHGLVAEYVCVMCGNAAALADEEYFQCLTDDGAAYRGLWHAGRAWRGRHG